MAQNWIKAIPLSSFNAASLIATYLPANGVGLPKACIKIRIYNNSTAVVTISFDGSVDHDVLPAGYLWDSPSQQDAPPGADFALWKVGQKIYVKSPAPGVGSITISGYYV